MYYKKSTGAILIRKSANIPDWVKWSHHSQGPNCCQECLMLDGCWFPLENAPTWPHHPHCHCTLDPIDYTAVMTSAASHSDYGKFDPYLFNTQGRHPHGKEKLFKQWGWLFCHVTFVKQRLCLLGIDGAEGFLENLRLENRVQVITFRVGNSKNGIILGYLSIIV